MSALDRYLECCHRVLTQEGAVKRLYTDSHDLPGAIIGIAEADEFFRMAQGRGRVLSARPWRPVLDEICWL